MGFGPSMWDRLNVVEEKVGWLEIAMAELIRK